MGRTKKEVGSAKWKQIGGVQSDRFRAIKKKVNNGGVLTKPQERFLAEKGIGYGDSDKVMSKAIKNRLKLERKKK